MNKKFATLAVLATSTITTLHIINSVHSSLCVSKNLLDNSENNYYSWRFGKVRYQKKGSGNPILLIHDLTSGSSSYEFNNLINNLTDKHEVYTIDLLGYGLSERPPITYTNTLYEQLINDFIRNVIGRKTSVIVTGESSSFVIMACYNKPEIFNKIILINPQNLYLQNEIPSKQTNSLKLIFEVPVIGTFVYHLLNTKKSFEDKFIEEYFYNKSLIKEKYVLNYLESAHLGNYTSKYSFASYVGKYMNRNIVHELKEINNSILIVGGQYEPDIENTIENYTYYNPSIESVILDNTKHLPQLENMDAVLEQIDMFL